MSGNCALDGSGRAAPEPRVSLIVAMARNRVIGRGNRLPWRLPADLAHFRRLTLDKPIVMGRRTWESLPGPLERRHHIVVTRKLGLAAPGCVFVPSPVAALREAAGAPEIMIIGGAALYRSMLPRADYLYLTQIAADIEGDTFFPTWNPSCWREVAREERARDAHNAFDLAFIEFERIRHDRNSQEKESPPQP